MQLNQHSINKLANFVL